MDYTIHYVTDLQRTIDFLIRVGQAGIVLNADKFHFARRIVDFAAFRISDETIQPFPKNMDAIRDFPTPTSTTDIRSWFGLVNQVVNCAQLRDIVAPFKPFLSPRCRFEWTPELERAFQASKESVIAEICHGVEIFDPTKLTCIRQDWSRQGIGYFLSQKHCPCDSCLPDCCTDGWRVTLAGSRLLTSAEHRYVPIEGETLAVAWGLEQSKYSTQGCNDLLVVTDHRSLVKILGDRTMDEIYNTRTFRLKQRTLPWSFDIAHLPGKTNSAADATSRHPALANEYAEPGNLSLHSEMDDAESAMAASLRHETNDIITMSWERISTETVLDPTLRLLLDTIQEGFPDDRRARAMISPHSGQIVTRSTQLTDVVILYRDRVGVHPSLRDKVLRNLNAAHQSSMESRARSIVFWPGMTNDIRAVREHCSACNRSAPSQAATPPIQSPVPSTPFESIFADFF